MAPALQGTTNLSDVTHCNSNESLGFPPSQPLQRSCTGMGRRHPIWPHLPCHQPLSTGAGSPESQQWQSSAIITRRDCWGKPRHHSHPCWFAPPLLGNSGRVPSCICGRRNPSHPTSLQGPVRPGVLGIVPDPPSAVIPKTIGSFPVPAAEMRM